MTIVCALPIIPTMRVTPKEQRLLKAFKQIAKKQLAARLTVYRLFGSWARGDATEESDVDILVVVRDLQRAEKNNCSIARMICRCNMTAIYPR